MWPDRVSNPGPLTYESGALPTVLRGPASAKEHRYMIVKSNRRVCVLTRADNIVTSIYRFFNKCTL